MQKNSSFFKREATAGLTTFLTMSYIVVVNPSILASAGIPFAGAMTATVLLCVFLTLMMGIYANLPLAVAPGMGVNTFFAFTLINGRHIPWPVALGIVFWSGVFFVLVSVTPLRVKIAKSIPPSLRASSAVGIGIMIALIGLKNAGLVVPNAETFGKMGAWTQHGLLCLLGLGTSYWLLRRKSPFAFIASILIITALGIIFGDVKMPDKWISAPDFSSTFLKLDPWGALSITFLPSIISLLFTDLFDSISTFVGIAQVTDLVDKNGEPVRLREGLIVDAFSTLSAGLFGTSSGTAYIESLAGIEVGGRTGWTAIFASICFLPFLFLGPMVGIVPDYATAPVLILVGAMMFRAARHLEVKNWEDLIPTFLSVALIPLTFSITQGILWGFVSHTVLYYVAGRRKEVSPWLFGVSAISALLLLLEQSIERGGL